MRALENKSNRETHRAKIRIFCTIYINAILTPSSYYYRYFKFQHVLGKGKGGLESEGDEIDERIQQEYSVFELLNSTLIKIYECFSFLASFIFSFYLILAYLIQVKILYTKAIILINQNYLRIGKERCKKKRQRTCFFNHILPVYDKRCLAIETM